MSTTMTKTAIPDAIDTRVMQRILEEGFGPGAWHGADLAAATLEVTAELAFWRPAPERHNIAEIALHHAYYVRSVRAQLTGRPQEPFPVAGEDWFTMEGGTLGWDRIREILQREQERLVAAVTQLPAGTANTRERFDLVLGITCHAVYHSGQIQLLKALAAAD